VRKIPIIIYALTVLGIGFSAPSVINYFVLKNPDELQIYTTILADFNGYRAKYGLSELTHDVRLDCAAQAHAEDVKSRRSCTIIGKNGTTPRLRVELCGLNEYSQVNVMVFCNKNWDFKAHLLDMPEHAVALQDHRWSAMGIGLKDDYYVIYLLQ
jgi:uncharacterized protein YkwD